MVKNIAERIRNLNPVYLFVFLLIAAIVVMNPNFVNPFVFMNFLKRSAPLIILATGQVFVLVSGGFDLCVGSLITLVVVGSSVLINGDPSQTWWVILVMFAIGGLVGLVNGVVVSYLKVPSIIATLGMMITLNGLTFMWSGGSPRGYLPDTFRFFGRKVISGVPIIKILPVALLVLIVVAAMGIWLMHRTNFGRMVHAVGDNPRAAALAGIAVPRIRILAFVCSSLCAVTAGILLGGFAGVSVNVGIGYELQAITACVIGGVLLLGGRGSVPAVLAGALALQALFLLLNLMGLPKPARDVVQGLILIAAVAVPMIRSRSRSG